MLLTRILQMDLTIAAISVPERGRVELGLLKRMCTSAAWLLLAVAIFSVGLRSEATGMDLASSLGLTESFEMRRLPLQVLEGSMVLTPQQPMERYDEGAIIASCLPLPMLVLRPALPTATGSAQLYIHTDELDPSTHITAGPLELPRSSRDASLWRWRGGGRWGSHMGGKRGTTVCGMTWRRLWIYSCLDGGGRGGGCCWGDARWPSERPRSRQGSCSNGQLFD
jgi:hypothetical protein